MNKFSEYTYQGYGISVSSFDRQGRESVRLAANEGYYDDVGGYWIFLEGRETRFDGDTGEAYFSLPFERREFKRFHEDPTLMKSLEKRPKDLSFLELKRILEAISPGEDPRVHAFRVRFNAILANPLSALIVVGLAVPFAASGVRVNPMIGVSKSFGLFFAI